MLHPLIRLARLPLRTKLALLVVVPLIGLTALAGQIVFQNVQTRNDAIVEESEVARVRLASDVSDALVAERDRTFSSITTLSTLQRARTISDEALADYAAASSLDRSQMTMVEGLAAKLEAVRLTLGDFDSMMTMQESAVGFRSGDEFEEFSRFDELLEDSLTLIQSDPNRLASPTSARNTSDVRLLAEFNISVRSELLAYFAIGEADTRNAAELARTEALKNAGATRQLAGQLAGIADPDARAAFNDLVKGENFRLLLALRERIDTESLNRDNAPSPELAPIFDRLFRDISGTQDLLVANATATSAQNSAGALRTLAVAAGVVGFLIVLIVGLAVSLLRSIRAPLVRLTTQSRRIARTDLPNLVASIRELGGEALIEMPDPIQSETDDEVGELIDAFNQLHATAVELAAEQAASRRTVSEMFVNMGRRNQKILMRLLSSLEQLERNERDPETLQDLFKIDHLATRMRRNAESLLVLAGAKTSRSFGSAIPFGDVIRASLSEVEDYERVVVDDASTALLNGKAVSDIAHLLAELIENALQFSPPSTTVGVLTKQGPEGLVITVGDRGIGLSPLELEANNRRIKSAADLSETPSRFLGLYVVGRLAARHGLDVELLAGVPHGLVSRITVPESLYESLRGVEPFPAERPAANGQVAANGSTHEAAGSAHMNADGLTHAYQRPMTPDGSASAPAAARSVPTAAQGGAGGDPLPRRSASHGSDFGPPPTPAHRSHGQLDVVHHDAARTGPCQPPGPHRSGRPDPAGDNGPRR